MIYMEELTHERRKPSLPSDIKTLAYICVLRSGCKFDLRIISGNVSPLHHQEDVDLETLNRFDQLESVGLVTI